MGLFVLISDIMTEAEEAGLIVGPGDSPVTVEGKKQANEIGAFINDKISNINNIYTSNLSRSVLLVHKIQVASKNTYLTKVRPTFAHALTERDFGVLNGTKIPFNSSIFTHSRIAPENGESIFQTRKRILTYVEKITTEKPDNTLLIVSHPFVCQILFNALLRQELTIVTEFWMKKGAFVVFDYSVVSYGIKWNYRNGYSTFDNSAYTKDQINSTVFREQGASTS